MLSLGRVIRPRLTSLSQQRFEVLFTESSQSLVGYQAAVHHVPCYHTSKDSLEDGDYVCMERFPARAESRIKLSSLVNNSKFQH